MEEDSVVEALECSLNSKHKQVSLDNSHKQLVVCLDNSLELTQHSHSASQPNNRIQYSDNNNLSNQEALACLGLVPSQH